MWSTKTKDSSANLFSFRYGTDKWEDQKQSKEYRAFAVRSQITIEDAKKMKISVILVDTETEAQLILQKLDAGMNFADLALKHSIGPGNEEGGNLGYIDSGYLMEGLNDVALNLKIGQQML